MINIMFICHGNICRSPMAEFVFRDMVQKHGLGTKFHIASSATSTEEIGNPVHNGTVKQLEMRGISSYGKYAVQLKKNDYEEYDFLIGMDSVNVHNICRITNKSINDTKIFKLLDLTDSPRDIADPWYNGDFDTTYKDVLYGCEALLKYLYINNFIK